MQVIFSALAPIYMYNAKSDEYVFFYSIFLTFKINHFLFQPDNN